MTKCLLVNVLQSDPCWKEKYGAMGCASLVLWAVDGPWERKKVYWPIAVPKKSRQEGHVVMSRASVSR